jgi:hypothetical protein
MSNNVFMPNLTLIVEILLRVLPIISAGGAFAIAHLHSFLAKNVPINADISVVEGELPDYTLKALMNEFEQGSY